MKTCSSTTIGSRGGLRFVFNYSDTEQAFARPVEGRDVLTGLSYTRGQTCAPGAWQLMAVRGEA